MQHTPDHEADLVSPFKDTDWQQRCTKYSALLLCAFGALIFMAARVAPKFRQLFQDMLGDLAKLPELTKLVLLTSRYVQDWFLFIVALFVMLMAVLWLSRAAIAVRVVCVGIMVGVLFYLLAAVPGLYMPYVQITQALSSPAVP